MADEGSFDPCECICNTEWAMRRLLSILRTSQQYCFDNECLGNPSENQLPDFSSEVFLISFWILLVAFLFASRPNSMRRQVGSVHKNPPDNRRDPPPPDIPPVD
ncbi:small integral membrane protein 14-like [Clavelina lepadiformis]|uniref:small integral membrane protein 14-like n=1 Tax=Clavelina lepadiformis TaxID=159417 RepID=UPI0040434DF9